MASGIKVNVNPEIASIFFLFVIVHFVLTILTTRNRKIKKLIREGTYEIAMANIQNKKNPATVLRGKSAISA